MKKLSLITLMIVTVLAANAQSLKYWYIADAKIACQYGNIMMSCLQVRSSPDSTWKPFQHEIEGFIWEPGVEVLIELTVTPIIDPLPDGPQFTYKYHRTVETKNTVLKQREILGATRWKLINIQSVSSMIPRVRPLGAWMQFDLDSHVVYGFGGCNSFAGNAEVLEGQINFGLMTSTLKSCQNDSLERIIMESIESNTQFYFRNNMLFITCMNGYTLHLRPEKRLDSLISEFSKPHIYRSNSYTLLRDGRYAITLDDVKEAGFKNFIFEKDSLTQIKKSDIALRLVNLDKESDIQSIEILTKPHTLKDINHAILIFKDGSRREIMIRYAL
ncbi:MAG: DUF4377 domain-containing protein [Bacteroidia bacterium]|nr:DUF4377 domain-containing protein [Bacteroidia bacterium]